MYQSLQGCRAIAAMLVVLFHLGGTFAQDKYFGFKGIDGPFAWGDAGVDFFFVLSGFLITIVHRRDFGRPQALIDYLLKRTIRIYPTYWVVCGVVLAAALAVPSLRQALPDDPLTTLEALTLFPLDPDVVGGTGSPILFVAWSLQYEVVFYALVAIVICSRTAGVLLLAGFVLLRWHCQFESACGFSGTFLSSNLIMLFGLGVVCAYVVTSAFRMPRAMLVALLAAAAFVVCGGIEVRNGHDAFFVDRRIVYGALSGLIIVALVQWESGHGSLSRHRWLSVLGDSSYSLYLIHIPIISVLVKLAVRFGVTGHAPLVVAYVAMFFVCVGCSVLFCVTLERPMLRWLRARLLDGRRRKRATGEAREAISPAPASAHRRKESLR